jgi:hypothetical protein
VALLAAPAIGEIYWWIDERRLEHLERNPHERAKTKKGRDRLASRWAETQQVKRDIESTRERLESYEERARRAGVPPGWLR